MSIKAEESANRAQEIVARFTDKQYATTEGKMGLEADISDVIADLKHLCDRYEIAWVNVLDRADWNHQGDVSEGGGRAAHRELSTEAA